MCARTRAKHALDCFVPHVSRLVRCSHSREEANSDSTSWTATDKWLNREVGLDDGTGFTRRKCTIMRKLCRPSGGSNTHVLGLLPSHSEYRTRSLIVLCSIIYPFAIWLFLLSSSIRSVAVSLSLRRG